MDDWQYRTVILESKETIEVCLMVSLAYCLESVSKLQYKEEKFKLKLTVSMG